MTVQERIADGIRQYVADAVTQLSYHEPQRDVSLLKQVADDADRIAAYIVSES